MWSGSSDLAVRESVVFIIFIWIITTLIITLDQLIFYKQWVKHHLSSYYKETSLKFLSLNSIMQTTLKEKT